MVTTVNIGKDHGHIFPELHVQTEETTSLANGISNLYKIQKIDSISAVVKLLSFAIEQDTSHDIQLIVNSIRREALQVNQLPGASTDFEVLDKEHELELITKELIIEAQNGSGGAITDIRNRIEYIIDALDTQTKLKLGLTLNDRDRDAMAKLKGGPQQIDVEEAFRIGIGVPKNYKEMLKLNQVLGTEVRSLPDSTNLSSTRTTLLDLDVANPGIEELVLEGIYAERPAQSELGEVNIFISRDSQDDLLTLDPAAFRGDNVRTNLFIPALNSLKVEVNAASGTHNSYKLSAVIGRRKIGVGYKAKLEEFAGVGNLPDPIEISTEERALIQQKNLKEIARTGMLAIP